MGASHREWHPSLRQIPAGDAVKRVADAVGVVERDVDRLVVFTLPVELVGEMHRRRYPEFLERREERRQEMMGVAVVAAAGAWYLGERLADVLLVAVGQKRVDLAQRVVGVADVDELRLAAVAGDGPMDGVGCQHLAHVAHVDGAGWRDRRGEDVAVTALHELPCRDVCPVHRLKYPVC